MRGFRLAGVLALLAVSVGLSFLLGGRSVAQERGGAPAYAFLEGKGVVVLLKPGALVKTKDLPGSDAVVCGTAQVIDGYGIKLKQTSVIYPDGSEVQAEDLCFIPWTAVIDVAPDKAAKKNKR